MQSPHQIGQAIRELRHRRGITGTVLAKKAGISQAKLSKIETGIVHQLKMADIERLLNILDAPENIRSKLRFAIDNDHRGGIHRYSADYPFAYFYEQELKSKQVRIFSYGFPALLQTLDWHQGLLRRVLLSTTEIQQAVKILIKRQDQLLKSEREYHFIMPEMALYTTSAGRTEQVVQLDRIERLMSINSKLTIGIIPLQSGLVAAGLSTFVLYDDRLLSNNITGSDVISSDPEIILTHQKMFAALERQADYNEAARAHLRRAQDFFSHQLS